MSKDGAGGVGHICASLLVAQARVRVRVRVGVRFRVRARARVRVRARGTSVSRRHVMMSSHEVTTAAASPRLCT